MTIRQDALNGRVTPIFEQCAAHEGVSVETLMAGVADGTICIPKNNNHDFPRVTGIGQGLKTKVNANIGSSKDHPELDNELQKLCVCLKAGADAVMDLSMGGEISAIRREILKSCPIPLGTVPIYQSIAQFVEREKKKIGEVTVDHIFKTIEEQARDGVDFMTVHCGITRDTLQLEYRRLHEQLSLTTVMVTHDMTEALLMADRIAVMAGGQIIQIGTPHDLLTHPEHDAVSQLMQTPRRQAESLERLMEEAGESAA